MHPTRLIGALVAAGALAVALTACSDDSSDGSGDGSSEQPVVVDITEQSGKIDPVGKVVQVDTGQEVELVVTSDVEDEIHVHSDPEHEFEVKAGDEERKFTFSVDTPGTIEVESHGLEVTILKLQVS